MTNTCIRSTAVEHREQSLDMRRVPILVVTDQVLLAPQLGNLCECCGSCDDTIKNRGPVSLYMCGTLKNRHCSMAISIEYQNFQCFTSNYDFSK